jgi:ribonuclease HI
MTIYYVVIRGRKPGIYESWSDAKVQIDNFFPAKFQKFISYDEAYLYFNKNLTTVMPTSINPETVMPTFKNPETIMPTFKNPETIMSTFKNPETIMPTFKNPETSSDKTLICFTDGSCIHNGKKNAKGGYAVVWPYYENYNSAESLKDNVIPTNNRAEYRALIKAFEIANEIDPDIIKTLIVHTDSMLLINSITKWLPTWRKNNYRKADGYVVSNLDLLKLIEHHMAKRHISLKHIRAHTGRDNWESKYNDLADKLAKSVVF